MKDACDTKIVKKDGEWSNSREEEGISKIIDEMTRLAKDSVNEGGYSYCNLDCLIEDF